MRVVDGMSTDVLTIGPTHTLHQAAREMARRHIGAAVVVDPDTSGLGILTERDVLVAVGAGQDPDTERVEAHLTSELVFASPDWTMEQAAEAMTRGGFRHLVVLQGQEVVGMISVRDIVQAWTAATAAG